MDIFQVLLSLSKIALHLRDMSKILYAHLECFSKDFLQIAFEQNKEIMSLHKLKKGFFYLQNIMIRRERINPFTWSSKHSSFLFVSFFAWTWQKKKQTFYRFHPKHAFEHDPNTNVKFARLREENCLWKMSFKFNL